MSKKIPTLDDIIDEDLTLDTHEKHTNIHDDNEIAKDTDKNSHIKPKVAIIVPYRDNAKHERAHQHDTFIKEIPKFLGNDDNYHIFIIEQSDDGRKFNRGKLLNIGYTLVKHLNQGYNTFIFHDVDLIPESENLRDWYLKYPEKAPIHIARIWDRYSSNPNYFGGIVSITGDMFEEIHGFPNNFWGWGGEDDELKLRLDEKEIKFTAPDTGAIRDLENKDLNAKLAEFKNADNDNIKNMQKTELLAKHDEDWRHDLNGLSTLQFLYFYQTKLNDQTTQYLVNVCGNEDQFDKFSSIHNRSIGILGT